jgi:acetylornithine/N-succinyldiaminopimelate aminotransferase
MTNESIKISEDASSVPSYAKWPVAFVKGEGATIWDADGKAYLDLYGGHCVTAVGHCHPHWVKMLSDQAATLGFYSNVAYNDQRARFQERLVAFAPDHITRVFLGNSGSEANETAVKLAMKGSFHGRTAGALSLTHLGNYRNQFPALVRETKAATFGDLDDLSALLDDDTAAVILEPVQSMNCVQVADASYYQGLVARCHQNGTLVIFDEIQTGMGRLGAPFAAELFGAEVDMITLAKGIGNGIPMSAVLTTEAVSETCEVGEQGTTFGGGPVACAAGNAVLDVIEREGLVENAKKMGALAAEMLVVGPVKGVRGVGLLLGLETEPPAKEVCRYLFGQGILAGSSAHPNVARLMPPLTLKQADLETLRAALEGFA